MNDPYRGREQTRVKHEILKSYLQGLAFKILHKYQNEIAFIDGFSGPWEEQTKDFSDTSFKIAIDVLKDVQDYFEKQVSRKVTIRCYFVEKNKSAYDKLVTAVSPYNSISDNFHVKTYYGEFENAIPDIIDFIGNSFSLTFIDPTGWTGYDYDKIRPLLRHVPGEVLINFMYEFVNRASGMDVLATQQSLEPILGRNWQERIDPQVGREEAIEKLFRQRLKEAGAFDFVASAQVKRATADRTLYSLAYGTRHDAGIIEFRKNERKVLQRYGQLRVAAKMDRREAHTGNPDLFAPADLPGDRTLENEIRFQKAAAKTEIEDLLVALGGQESFRYIRNELMQKYNLLETDIKNVCVDLAKAGQIEATWKERGKRVQKPNADAGDIIRLKR